MGMNAAVSQAKDELDGIERDLDSGAYQIGQWQKHLSRVKKIGSANKALSDDLTRVSNKLHRRNKFLEGPLWIGMGLEYALCAASMMLSSVEGLLPRFLSVVMLTLCLQPLIKFTTGMMVGVKYSYVYLWYFEPRFKMQFGSYLCLVKWKKLVLQFSGSIGTPVALLIGWQVLKDAQVLSGLCLLGAVGTFLLQLGAFAAGWFGVRKLGPFLLSNLTTPASLAKELREG